MRAFVIAGLLACCLPATAFAADGQCLVMPEGASFSPPLRVDGPQSRALEGEEAASLPVADLWSDAAEMPRVVFRNPREERSENNTVLWCGGTDSRECQQDHGQGPYRDLFSAPLAQPAPLQIQAPRSVTLVYPRRVSQAGPEGVRQRPLRPPRG